MSNDFNNQVINNAAQDRFPNSELFRIGFEAGAEWQREQDAKRGPRSAPGVQDLPNDCTLDISAFNMLKQIHNAVINEQKATVIAWTQKVSDDLYHVTTRQESIDIEQRRMISEILDLMRPTNEEAAPETDTVIGVDLATGPDVTAVWAYDTETRKATPLEEISDEMLNMLGEQLPAKVYVEEVERRQKLKATSYEAESMRKDRDGWRHAYERLVSDILHGRAFSVTIKPD